MKENTSMRGGGLYKKNKLVGGVVLKMGDSAVKYFCQHKKICRFYLTIRYLNSTPTI